MELVDIIKSTEINQPLQLHHAAKYNSWVEIDTQAIHHNIASYKNVVAPSFLAPVIKSNAYGHGIALVAAICQANPLVDMLCVVSVTEGLYLRSIGIKKPILVLSILRDDLLQAIEQDLQLVVKDISLAVTLNQLAKQAKKQAEIHVKIDTGLSRLGFLAESALESIMQIAQMSHLTIKGMFTHFAESESIDQTFTNLQIAKFQEIVGKVENENISISLRHTSCSAAITANAHSHFNMTRLGIGLYGLWSSDHNKNVTQQSYPSFNLKPALTWKTTIIQIKSIPAGSYIGYERTYQTQKTSRIATLPIGYYDGYDRRFSNTGFVMINNKPAPVVGRVAMNLTMIDVTDLPAQVDDEVILLGNYPEVSAQNLAQRSQTINYEVVTRINPLLPRMSV